MKIAVRILVGLLALLVVAGLAGLFFVDSLAKKAVERGGTYALGVPTELGSASIGLFSGEFELERLRVSNPPGFSQPDFFTMRALRLDFPLAALREPRVVVPLLEIDGIAIDLERNAKGTNYAAILDHLEHLQSAGPSAPEVAAEEGGSSQVYVLQKLVIRDVHASIALLPLGGEATRATLSIPEVVVTELGTDMTLPQICALVVRTILQAAIQNGSGVLPEELMNDLRGRMQELEAGARELAHEQLEEAAQKVGGEAGKALQEAGSKALDGLLNKKKKD